MKLKRVLICTFSLALLLLLAACAVAQPALQAEVKEEAAVEQEEVTTTEKEEVVLATVVPDDAGGGAETASTGEAQSGGTLHMGKEGAFEYQLWSWEAEMWQEDGVSHNALIRISHDMSKLLPDLATGWTAADDGLTYTFDLRDDVQWHDGEPFTADDIIWTYNALVNPETGTRWGFQWLSGIAGYQDVADGNTDQLSGLKKIDDHTLEITFSGLAPTNLWTLGYLFIFPEHILGDVPYAEIKSHPYWSEQRIGTGPFKFASYAPKQSIVYERNDDYWGKVPYLDRIIWHIYDNAETALVALEKGEIDTWAGYSAIPIDEIERFSTMDHINVLPGPSGVTQYIMINQLNPDFPWGAQKEFRQALHYCVDRELLVETMWAENYADLTYGPVLQERYQNPDLPTYDYDPDKGRELLDSIDYDYDAEIDLNYYYASKFFGDLMAVIQAQLAECGIKVNPALLDGPSWAEKFNENYKESGGAMLGYAAHGIPIFPDDHFLLFVEDRLDAGGRNTIGWYNDEFAELAAEARGVVDEEARTELYHRIQEILTDEVPFFWMWHPHRPPGVNARVQNSRWGPTYVPYYQGYEEWWIKPE